MTSHRLAQILGRAQVDVGRRGLRKNASTNLVSASVGGFEAACRSLAGHPRPSVVIVTGFFIAGGKPPAAETDGPLGALHVARCLCAAGVPVAIAVDPDCKRALQAGLKTCGLVDQVPLALVPGGLGVNGGTSWRTEYWERFTQAVGSFSHLISIERAGPSHTPGSVGAQTGAGPEDSACFEREVPMEHHDRCHNARGDDITGTTRPAHVAFEEAAGRGIVTMAVGDGGNEIGMGKIPWAVIRANVRLGALIACRVATSHLIVAGISNWGAYALSAGFLGLRGLPAGNLFDTALERQLLETMVSEGPLVDGISGRTELSVDGIAFEEYARALADMGAMVANEGQE